MPESLQDESRVHLMLDEEGEKARRSDIRRRALHKALAAVHATFATLGTLSITLMAIGLGNPARPLIALVGLGTLVTLYFAATLNREANSMKDRRNE